MVRSLKYFFAILVWLFSYSVSFSADKVEGNDPPALHLQVSIDEAALEESRLVVESVLSNRSTRTISISSRKTPFANEISGSIFSIERRVTNFGKGELQIDASTEPGSSYRRIPYTGITVKQSSPDQSEFLLLSPGQEIKKSVDVSELYAFPSRATIRLYFDAPVMLPNEQFLTLKSNTLIFDYQIVKP